MARIILNEAGGSTIIEREFELNQTIHDVKTYLLNHYKMNFVSEITNETPEFETESVKIIYNGKIIKENVPLVTLHKDGEIVLTFTMKAHKIIDDVPMNEIEVSDMVEIVYRGKKIRVNTNQLIKKNGKLVYITKKEKRISQINEIRNGLRMLRIDLVVKIAAILALYMSKNKEFAFLLIIILILRALSELPLKIKMKSKDCCLYKKIASFFITMFMINADQILDFSE